MRPPLETAYPVDVISMFVSYSGGLFASPGSKRAVQTLIGDLRRAHNAGVLHAEVIVPGSLDLGGLSRILHFLWAATAEAFESHRLIPDDRMLLVRIHRSISALRDVLAISKRQKEAAA
jgi:hypothetical protein